MALVISAKGKNLTAWRAASEFAISFREALLNRTATLLSDQTGELFRDVECLLEERAAAHDASLARMRHLVVAVADFGDSAGLKQLVDEFYQTAYSFFGWNRSATAFYQLSAQFHKAVIGAVVRYAKENLGLPAHRLPPVAIIGLGPCGRNEISPFCRMQLLLIHGEAEPHMVAESLGLLGRTVHEVLEASGLMLDEIVTPRNPEWRAQTAQLREKLVRGMQSGVPKDQIELLRLADQSVLYTDEDLCGNFRADCRKLLFESRPAMQNLMSRLNGLTTGIGLMGGVRLERRGPHEGKFRLLDHALLPLSSGITALSLLKGLDACETPQCIRELLNNGWLNVEMAERLFEAWHQFNELRLTSEACKQPYWESPDTFYLDYAGLDTAGQEQFKYYLETVAGLLRHVVISYNEWEEQTAW